MAFRRKFKMSKRKNKKNFRKGLKKKGRNFARAARGGYRL
jgi:hypothetical protein